MPAWAGRWKGGRYYVDDDGRKVFFIERRVNGKQRAIKLATHDETLANGQLATFEQDPAGFNATPPARDGEPEPVHITQERLTLYMESIAHTVEDHRAARRKDLFAWAKYRDAKNKPIDLRTVDKRALRIALASFRGDPKDNRRTGGFKRRAEALNTFCNFLVSEGDLDRWNPLTVTETMKPAATRAERVAYSIEDVTELYRTLKDQALRDLLMVRASTGMHHTEIEQLEGARIFKGPLPDKGVGIRLLDGKHEIAGVLQFKQKKKPRHRISVTKDVLEAALRLRDGVPGRIQTWKAFNPIIPSNLRHTWITMAGEWGEYVQYRSAGVHLDQIQQIAGHSVGSKVTLSSYDKLQVPPMVRLPLKWDVLERKAQG